MIEIVEYDQRWPAEFAALARVLRAALGSYAQRIDPYWVDFGAGLGGQGSDRYSAY